jgi:cytochrome b
VRPGSGNAPGSLLREPEQARGKMGASAAGPAPIGGVWPRSKHVRMVPAWDLPTRLFHWALVLLIIGGFVTRLYFYSDLTWHKWNGYGVLTLITFRVIWGFVGGSTARFSAFFPTPMAVLRHAGGLLRRDPRRFLGHNPLGGAMVLAFLVAIPAQALTGLFNTDDVFFDGPLAKIATSQTVRLAGIAHHYIWQLILALAAIHIAANLLYQFVKREKLISAMVSGEKPCDDYVDAAEARGGGCGLALVCLAASAAIVLGTIRLVGGEL